MLSPFLHFLQVSGLVRLSLSSFLFRQEPLVLVVLRSLFFSPRPQALIEATGRPPRLVVCVSTLPLSLSVSVCTFAQKYGATCSPTGMCPCNSFQVSRLVCGGGGGQMQFHKLPTKEEQSECLPPLSVETPPRALGSSKRPALLFRVSFALSFLRVFSRSCHQGNLSS